MKILHIMAAGVAVLTLAYCKTTKTPAATPAPPPVATATPPPAERSPAAAMQLEITEKRWPGTAEEELKEGHVIYTTKCVRCHIAYKIEEFSEKKWLHEIDDMSPKAKLSPEEKLKLTKYVLSYRETKEKLKSN